MDKTFLSGKTIFAPIEPGNAKPIVQNPFEIKHVFGSVQLYSLATHILCAPTSDKTMSSPFITFLTSDKTLCGFIGKDLSSLS